VSGLDELIAAAAGPDPTARMDAFRALIPRGEEAFDPVLAALDDARGSKARRLGQLLLRLEGGDQVPKLIPLMNHASVPLSVGVPWRLAHFRDARAVPALLQALAALPHAGIVFALGEIGDEAAIGPLREHVETTAANTVPDAIVALAKLGDHDLASKLAVLATRPHSDELRAAATGAMASVAFEGQWEAVEAAAADPSDDVRRAAVDALYALGTARAAKILAELAAAEGPYSDYATERLRGITGGVPGDLPEGVVLRYGGPITVQWLIGQLAIPRRGVDALDEFVRVTGLRIGSREQEYDAERWPATARVAVEAAGFHFDPGALVLYGRPRPLPTT